MIRIVNSDERKKMENNISNSENNNSNNKDQENIIKDQENIINDQENIIKGQKILEEQEPSPEDISFWTCFGKFREDPEKLYMASMETDGTFSIGGKLDAGTCIQLEYKDNGYLTMYSNKSLINLSITATDPKEENMDHFYVARNHLFALEQVNEDLRDQLLESHIEYNDLVLVNESLKDDLASLGKELTVVHNERDGLRKFLGIDQLDLDYCDELKGYNKDLVDETEELKAYIETLKDGDNVDQVVREERDKLKQENKSYQNTISNLEELLKSCNIKNDYHVEELEKANDTNKLLNITTHNQEKELEEKTTEIINLQEEVMILQSEVDKCKTIYKSNKEYFDLQEKHYDLQDSYDYLEIKYNNLKKAYDNLEEEYNNLEEECETNCTDEQAQSLKIKEFEFKQLKANNAELASQLLNFKTRHDLLCEHVTDLMLENTSLVEDNSRLRADCTRMSKEIEEYQENIKALKEESEDSCDDCDDYYNDYNDYDYDYLKDYDVYDEDEDSEED